MSEKFCAVMRFAAVFGFFTLMAPLEISGETGRLETSADAGIGALPSPVAAEGDWPWWRGPAGNNHCEAGQNPPLRWSETENVLWRVEMAGGGHGTPCIQGGRIFLPSGDKEGKSIWMDCLDRDSGKRIWRQEVYRGAMPKIHANTSHAAATPACDGQSVFFPYQTDSEIRMVALDLDGKILWDEPLSPYDSIQGFSASPVFHRAAVIVPTDGKEHNKLTALHRRSGKAIWRIDVPAEQESYGSALVAQIAGRRQLVLVGPDHVRAYNPDNGASLWQCDGPAKCYVASAVAGDGMVFATGGWPKKALLAIRADGSGNVTDTHLAWKNDDNKSPYVPSPLLDGGLLYALNDSGRFRCYEAATGAIVWEEKLDDKFYSSPVLAGDRIYAFSRTGTGFVFKKGRQFELLAKNTLTHGAFATPAICRDRIYLRTLKVLYCLSENKR